MEDLISFMQWHKERGPAPKEEVMPIETINMPDDDFDYEQEMKAENSAERHARFERAYMAALTGFCAAQPISGVIDFDPIYNSKRYAFETVRQWDSMMDQLDWEER